MADQVGSLANWIVGGIVGGLIGGITAALTGDSFWAGAAQGAVSGMIAGAGVDIALAVVATGGIAGVAIAGCIAYAGGFWGNGFGEETYSLATTGHLAKPDSGMLYRSLVSGGTNVAAMGLSALFTCADEGIDALNKSPKLLNIAKAAIKKLTNCSVQSSVVCSAFYATHIVIQNTMINMVM